jgi:DNA uptake protein ComE-like DNA-binding protein
MAHVEIHRMKFRLTALVTSSTIALCLSGCMTQDSGAQSASNESVSDNARQDAKSLVLGVSSIFQKDKPISYSEETVNVNYATEKMLSTLPGITPARARKIINNRPYATPQDLVLKGMLTKAEYARIAGHVVAWDN